MPYGATPAIAALVPADRILGRVVFQSRSYWRVLTEDGEFVTRPRSRMPEPPVAGDWVVLDKLGTEHLIDAVLPRRTAIARKTAGLATTAQVVAANVDVVFLVTSLDDDFNSRRLERYLALVWESNAQPVVVLTKADQASDDTIRQALDDVGNVGRGVAVHVVSSLTGQGIDALRSWLVPGRTLAVLGSSGIGKSTLVNLLAGQEVMATGTVRSDGRGRHTTTHRELILLPDGGVILDTPGMRELQLWSAEAGLATVFSDVQALAEECRFTNCTHEREPGCVVREALDAGSLDPLRYESWRKLQAEQGQLVKRQEAKRAAGDRRRRREPAKSDMSTPDDDPRKKQNR